MSNSIFGVRPIDMDLFFTVSDDDLLRQVYREFTHDLDRLKRAYSISNRHAVRPSTPSPSQIIYGTQYDEVNRTLVSLLCIRWIYRNQYEIFTGTQAGSVMLARPSFDKMREIFMTRLKLPIDLYALLAYVVVNDLGKDPQLASDYYSKTGEDISDLNHDIILLKAMEAGLVPSIDRLPEEYKDEIIAGIRLGAEFNPGQLVQAENVPACLSGLLDMRGHEGQFKFHFMQQLLDISGAAGHEEWTCASKFIEPIAKAYQDVYEVAYGIIWGDQGLRQAYDMILTRRGQILYEEGFKSLDVSHPEDRALMRLLCMGGVSRLENAKLYLSAWENLDEATRHSLVHTLNVDGSVTEPAVLPTYMPAMLTQGLAEASSISTKEKGQRLHYMLRYLSRVLTPTEEQHGRVLVVERSVLWVVKDVIQSRQFEEDPAILERIDVPKSAIAKSV